MENRDFRKHTLCLCAAFSIGNSLIFLPRGNITETLIGAAFGFILLFAAANLSEKVINHPVFCAVLCIFSLVEAIIPFLWLTDFLKADFLQSTPKFFIFLAVILCIFFLSRAKKSALFKFSLVSFTVTAVFRAVLSILLIGNSTLDNIFSALLPLTIDGTLKSVYTFLPALIVMIFIRYQNESKKFGFLGFSLSVSQIVGFTFLTFGVFGGGTHQFTYPLTAAISCTNLGTVFTRLDTIIYALIFLCSVIKSAVCFKTAKITFLKTFYHC